MKASRFFAAFAAFAAIMTACNPEEPKVEDKISATPETVTFEAEGGSIKVAVSTEGYTVSGAESWLTVTANGKELELKADPNTVREEKKCNLVLSYGTASCKVSVTQKAGSPYLGYKLATAASVEYAGTSLYRFLKPVTEDYGGQAFMLVETEDASYAIEFFTELFASAEEVALNSAVYTLGKDGWSEFKMYAVPGTFSPGVDMSDEEDTNIMGSYLTETASAKTITIVGGTFEIIADKDAHTVKLDLVDSEGGEHKVVYEGKVDIDTESALYPGESERVDPTEDIFYASLEKDVVSEDGTVETWTLMIVAGDPNGKNAMSFFQFNAAAPLDMNDLSGMYFSDPENPGAAGTANLGALITMGDFSFPQGSFIMYGSGDYLIADGMVSIILNKNEDGTYTFSGVLMNAEEDPEKAEMVMFLEKVIDIDIKNGGEEQGEEEGN